MEKFQLIKVYSDDRYGTNKTHDELRSQLEWIKRQLEYSEFNKQYKLRYDLKKGEIYEFDWGINVHAEFSNRHYGVVLADSDIFNPLVVVCPLKTNHNGAHPKSDIDLGKIDGLNTNKTTLAVVNQIRTIDKLRMFTKRAIGLKDGGQYNEELFENEKTIIRLDEEKVKMILDFYKNYLF